MRTFLTTHRTRAHATTGDGNSDSGTAVHAGPTDPAAGRDATANHPDPVALAR